ncbi:phosphate acyltransferase PlsX [Gemmatimonas aurantiaca]|nr:phosphate acyltransferase PlsX [Gemmatimonas aurantiaca]
MSSPQTNNPPSSDSSSTVRIALDVMGSDNGPATIVEGGVLVAQEFFPTLQIVLVGREDEIKAVLATLSKVPSTVSIVHADHEILMSDPVAEAIRREGTSVAVALQLQKSGEVDAFISTGNTGAVMAGSLLTLGRIPGVNRPAISALFPTKDISHMATVLDVGANVVCKPVNLVQFAALGSAYVSAMNGIEKPTVGLLSIGEERSKGNELIFESHKMLERSSLNFVGNIEGRDVLSGEIDVVVTDGFTGNIILKFAESISPFLTTRIRHQVSTNVFSRFGALLMYPFLRRLRKAFDYAESGGAPLLGINGVTMICHGTSSPKAIKNGATTVMRMVQNRIVEKTRQLMKENDLLHIRAQQNVQTPANHEKSSVTEKESVN